MRISLFKELFAAWFRIGLFTFGGGYAMLPLIEKEVIDKKGWATKEEILDIYAVAQSVPGVIAVNTAIFLGNRLAGPLGAAVATVGVIAPSIIVIILIALFFMQLQANKYVMSIFSGIRAAVVGLVAAAALRIGLASFPNRSALLIGIGAFLLNMYTSLHAAWIILAGGIIGFMLYYRVLKRAEPEVRHQQGSDQK